VVLWEVWRVRKKLLLYIVWLCGWCGGLGKEVLLYIVWLCGWCGVLERSYCYILCGCVGGVEG